MGFNSQPPEGGWLKRPKQHWLPISFNSQPPEGGWLVILAFSCSQRPFQLTAARRRLVACAALPSARISFQLTAARRRLGFSCVRVVCRKWVSTHSRPKAAGQDYMPRIPDYPVSTHSRPKAAGPKTSTRWMCGLFQLTAARRRLADSLISLDWIVKVSTHSRPKAAGF